MPTVFELVTTALSPSGQRYVGPGSPGHRVGWEAPPGWRHIATHLIAEEYALPWARSQGQRRLTADAWSAALLQRADRDSFMRALISANYVAGADGEDGERLRQDWLAHVLSSTDVKLAEALFSALSRPGGPRVLLDRGSLLRVLKLVVNKAPVKVRANDELDARVLVTLLAHALTFDVTPPQPDEKTLGGFPERLFMELVQSAHFFIEDDFGDAIARARLIWTSFERRLRRNPPRAPLPQLFREATGLDLDDAFAIGFACYSQAVQASVSTAPTLNLRSLGLPVTAIDAFLALFAGSPADLATALEATPGGWEFLPIEMRPLLLVEVDTVAVLDVHLLQQRMTDGLYWMVHDHEKQRSETDRLRWTQTFAELLEMHAVDQLRRLLPTLDPGAYLFTEDDLIGITQSRPDLGIGYGETLILADIVNHHMTVAARQKGAAAAFASDIEKSVIKKARQIHNASEVLLGTPRPDGSPVRHRVTQLIPIVIEGSSLPVNILTLKYTERVIASKHLLRGEGTAPLLIVNLSELDMVETLVHSGLDSFGDLLRDWAQSGPSDSLHNFIAARHSGVPLVRPPSIAGALNEQLDLITERFRHLQDTNTTD